MSNTTEELDSIADEPDTAPPLTVDEQRARRLSVASPLDRAIQGRPFGQPRSGAYVHALRQVAEQITTPAMGLDPGVITAMDGFYDPIDKNADGTPKVAADATVVMAAEAIGAMRSVVINVIEAREKSKRNPTLASEAAQVLAVDDYAAKVWESPSVRGDTARKALDARIAEREASLRTEINAGANVSTPLAAEVRAHCKGLRGAAERQRFLEQLVEQRDTASLAAVLRAPAFLSGMTADAQQATVLLYNQRTRPEVLKEIEFLTAVKAKLETAHHLYVNEQLWRAQGVRQNVVADLRARVKAAAF